MFQIHDFLVWIRIRGSMPLTNGSAFGSGMKSVSGCGSGFYYYICLMIEGSGSRARSGSGSIPLTSESGTGSRKLIPTTCTVFCDSFCLFIFVLDPQPHWFLVLYIWYIFVTFFFLPPPPPHTPPPTTYFGTHVLEPCRDIGWRRGGIFDLVHCSKKLMKYLQSTVPLCRRSRLNCLCSLICYIGSHWWGFFKFFYISVGEGWIG